MGRIRLIDLYLRLRFPGLFDMPGPLNPANDN
jgi:hypothetical protein